MVKFGPLGLRPAKKSASLILSVTGHNIGHRYSQGLNARLMTSHIRRKKKIFLSGQWSVWART